MSQYSSHPGSDQTSSRLGAAVSDAVAGLLRDTTGRGPTRIRSFVHDDVIVCVVHGTMTLLEHTLAEAGEDAAIEAARRRLHATLAPRALERVARLTGREVRVTLADHRAAADAGVFVFLLRAESP